MILGDDPAAARATAGRMWDRTPGTEPAVQMANRLGTVFSTLDCKPRWRERLPELAIPALVVHGRRDPFFPVGNGEALAREIPGARLLVLEQAATAIPDAAAERSQRRCSPSGYPNSTPPPSRRLVRVTSVPRQHPHGPRVPQARARPPLLRCGPSPA